MSFTLSSLLVAATLRVNGNVEGAILEGASSAQALISRRSTPSSAKPHITYDDNAKGVMQFDFAAHRESARRAFANVRPTYEQLAETVRNVLRMSIPASCPIHSIEFRAKGLDQFADKASKPMPRDTTIPKYADPLREITDLAGVRVITFFPRNIDDVCRATEAEFDVVEKADKGAELYAENKFGYQSIHYLVRLKRSRTDLPEYARFDGKIVEVQVRTILQHAWAEMEHDIQYKSVQAIPPETRRRFMSLAGMLEIADREFQAIQDADTRLKDQLRSDVENELSRSVGKRPALSDAGLTEGHGEAVSPQERSYIPGSARALVEAGEYVRAVMVYDDIIKKHPLTHTNYLGRAKAYFLSGQLDQALADLRRAEELYPEDPQIKRLLDRMTNGIESDFGERRRADAATTDAIANGDADGARRQIQISKAHGLSGTYEAINTAIVEILDGRYDAAEQLVQNLVFTHGTPLAINRSAIVLICRLARGVSVEAEALELTAQVRACSTYSYVRAPFRWLEAGLERQTSPALGVLREVKAILTAQN